MRRLTMDERRFLKEMRKRAEAVRKGSNLMPVEQWLASRKEAGLKINPETAEVMWLYAQTLDPYGVYPDLPEEFDSVGRKYFARASESDEWVDFGDLPDVTLAALRERIGQGRSPELDDGEIPF